ncbi:YigZ family protein [Arthrobacter frigidicola]|nr:YigZ family protein [Arthrobacter frigidicola]
MIAAHRHPTAYSTVRGEHRNELEIRRSRFITVLRRVRTEAEANALLAQLRTEFPTARHHCSAYLIGAGRTIQRAHDDGEPAGTAGAPMLEALSRHGTADLSDTAAVVVRYFGGILLGAGGLIRAYSQSVTRALDEAPLLHRRLLALHTVPVAHAEAGRVENELRAAATIVRGTSYTPKEALIEVALEADADSYEDFQRRLAASTAGTSVSRPAGTTWVDLD